jgi:protein-L-isoaspartate O-methyltransferase
VNIEESRAHPREQERIHDVMRILPSGFSSVLEIGARDGYLSSLLPSRFSAVTALDLQTPDLGDERIVCVAGDVTRLDFENDSFDVVLCTEVLEHIRPQALQKACDEIARVARHNVVVGVPYQQDLRVGRTTCGSCSQTNPPWGHVNRFDEAALQELFHDLTPVETSFVGRHRESTNRLSAFLLDQAGNPWGTYHQEEPCIHCRRRLMPRSRRNLLQRILAAMAVRLNRLQEAFTRERPRWVHMVFDKPRVSKERERV